MAFNVEYKEGGSYSTAPAGQFQAVCCELLDHGYTTKSYPNQQTGQMENRPVREVQFVFQLNKVDDATGKRFEVRSKKLNALTLGEKSGLRQFLQQWRGHDLTDAEKLPPGIDLEQLIGRNALIGVVHVAGQRGGTFANIGSIMPLMEGMAAITPLNYESKQALVDKANAAAAANPQAAGAVPQMTGQAAVAADDIPF